jgi:hypothetical protein
MKQRMVVAMVMAFAMMGPLPGRAETPPLPEPATRAWQTGVFRADRLEHASLAASSGLAIGILARQPAAALGGALTLGLAKELWDRRHSHFDRGDLIADGVGAVLALVGTTALER